jgi:hypothetical protein
MFEVYAPRSKREAREKEGPEIKISKQSIVLNKKARILLQAESLELAYDKGGKIIRIRKADEGGLNMKKTKVFAKGFLEHFNIKEKGKYRAEFKEDENTFFVKLK